MYKCRKKCLDKIMKRNCRGQFYEGIFLCFQVAEINLTIFHVLPSKHNTTFCPNTRFSG